MGLCNLSFNQGLNCASAWGACSLKHWTTRKVLAFPFSDKNTSRASIVAKLCRGPLRLKKSYIYVSYRSHHSSHRAILQQMRLNLFDPKQRRAYCDNLLRAERKITLRKYTFREFAQKQILNILNAFNLKPLIWLHRIYQNILIGIYG